MFSFQAPLALANSCFHYFVGLTVSNCGKKTFTCNRLLKKDQVHNALSKITAIPTLVF